MEGLNIVRNFYETTKYKMKYYIEGKGEGTTTGCNLRHF